MPTGAAFEIFNTGRYVYWYGILIALAVALGVWIALKRSKRYGWSTDDLLDFALWAIPIAVICARLYYVAFEWDRYKDNLIDIVKIWEGGLAIYGGVIGGVITAAIFCKVRKKSFMDLADCVIPSLVLGQAIGRWGNFFNQEAFGVQVTNPAHMWFPLAVHIDATDTIHYATFFYESMWCFLIFIFLMVYSKKFRHKGDCLIWYLGLYGLERALVEGLRTDSLYIGNFRVSQLLSALMFVAAVGFVIYRAVWEKKHGRAMYGAPYFVRCADGPSPAETVETTDEAEPANGDELTQATVLGDDSQAENTVQQEEGAVQETAQTQDDPAEESGHADGDEEAAGAEDEEKKS